MKTRIYATSAIGEDIRRLRELHSGEYGTGGLNEHDLITFAYAVTLRKIRRLLGNVTLDEIELI